MAFKSVRISDLSGTEGNDEDFLTVVVRQHPDLDEPVQFDALPGELAGLKAIKDIVILEVKEGSKVQQVYTTAATFAEISEDMPTVLANADGLRGRRKGYRPNQQRKG